MNLLSTLPLLLGFEYQVSNYLRRARIWALFWGPSALIGYGVVNWAAGAYRADCWKECKAYNKVEAE